MAAPGRPTPHRIGTQTSDGPRFRELEGPLERRAEVNPYYKSHQEFGPPLLPASEAWRWRNRWDECFGRTAPLHLEIGPGNGFFLAEVARRNPDANIVAVEIRYKRTVLCARKLQRAGVTNARIIRYHAAFLDDLFDAETLDVIYVNHPDPWSKARHEKNRLISRWFLEDVARLLRPGGTFRLKSDFRDNVDRVPMLLAHGPDNEPLPQLPLAVTGRSNDVITGPAPWPDDIETNYQSKFRRKGEPVYAIELTRTPGPMPAADPGT
jgi:tRNA (guanine-N7-)-methyltransferase